MCQQGPPALVPLSSLKSHMASSHREKLLAESPRGDSDVGNHGDSTHEVNTRTKSARMHVMSVVCGTAFTTVSSLDGHRWFHTGHKRCL